MWHIPEYIDADSIDTSWAPPTGDAQPYVYHFLSQHILTDSKRLDVGVSGVTYTVPGAIAIKIVRDKKVLAKPLMSRWNVPKNIDLNSIDFTWHPNAFDPPYVYHFPSQHQRSSGLTYTVPGAVDIKFVDHFVVEHVVPQIFYIDFLNPGSKEQFAKLKAAYPEIKSTRYVDTHLNVLKRIANLAESKFVWVISSICDYNTFDFTWHPEPWQQEMIHVFPSGYQERGDTFYINVDSFKTQQYDLEILDWFNVINYCNDQYVHRIMQPAVKYDSDNLIDVIKNHDFKFPYVLFTNLKWIQDIEAYDICLWSEKDRTVESYSNSNATCIVPRDIKIHLQKQVYDYPYIDKNIEINKYIEESLDVVYISNGEPDAERWYNHLESIVNKNLLHRVTGVTGRMAAYKAAAEKSNTPWFFAVFAKLEVDPNFDWSWQPDYFQEPKHYIFHARNPVNGLVYGHQAMIAYNKRLVLETVDSGLDFTLSKAHEVVPILSGTAHYDQDAWTTWRTAFREVVKLKYFSVKQPSIETEFRLKKWLAVGNGQFGNWSILGARDAIEYYNIVNGEYDKLMLSYEWAWLRTYYSAKY